MTTTDHSQTCPHCGSRRVNQDTEQNRPWTTYFTCADCGRQWGAADHEDDFTADRHTDIDAEAFELSDHHEG
ncbi:hypothetical protein GCM10010519_76890 [Streptomyces lactacystinicus]